MSCLKSLLASPPLRRLNSMSPLFFYFPISSPVFFLLSCERFCYDVIYNYFAAFIASCKMFFIKEKEDKNEQTFFAFFRRMYNVRIEIFT